MSEFDYQHSYDELADAVRDNKALRARVAALEAALRYIRDYAGLPIMADFRENALAAIVVTAEDALAATDAEGGKNGDDQ